MSDFKTISDGETVVVLYKGTNTAGWRHCFTTTDQERADLYIAGERRRDAQKMLHAALTHIENGNRLHSTRELIELCEDYIAALLSEDRARKVLGIAEEEAA